MPTQEDRNVVVFKIWKSLSYPNRMILSFSLLLAGFLIQILFMNLFIAGCFFLFAGNLLLLVSGYDNRVKFGTYDPGMNWERVDKEKFSDLIVMQKKMKNWDRSTTDCSNPLGCFLMLLLMATIAGLIALGTNLNIKPLVIIGIDAALLLFPHWVTGLRRISLIMTPALSQKIQFIETLIASMKNELSEHKIEYYMLLSGKDKKIPNDLKFKIDIKGHHPDFLGLYGQIVMNNVQGTMYPYFYTVLVAKKGYDLKIQKTPSVNEKSSRASFWKVFVPIPSITKTLQKQKDVEVLVIRQTTTQQTGYHTDQTAARRIFFAGLKSAENNAVKK